MTSTLAIPTERKPDLIWQMATQMPKVDGDTAVRGSQIITPTTPSSLPATAPFNSGQNTNFTFLCSPSDALVFNNTRLRMRMLFTQLGVTTADVPRVAGAAGVDTNGYVVGTPYSSVPWNLAAQCINNVTVRLNDDEVYHSNAGHFASEYTARMLSNYSYPKLNTLSQLFTPVFDDKLLVATDADRTAANTSIPAAGTYINTLTLRNGRYDALSTQMSYCNFVPNVLTMKVPRPMPKASTSAAAALEEEPLPVGVAAAATLAYAQTNVTNPLANSIQAITRANKYLAPNCHQRPIVIEIPLADLIPRWGTMILRNASKMQIDIQWTNNQDLLECMTVAAASTGAAAQYGGSGTVRGGVYVIGCDMVTDSYMPSTPMSGTLAEQKQQKVYDYVTFINSEVRPTAYTPNNQIVLAGIRNLQAVMAFVPSTGVSMTGAAPPAVTNGVATGAGLCQYASPSQFLMQGAGTTANTARITADEPSATCDCFDSFQMQYGTTTYPANPVITSYTANGAKCFSGAALYDFYTNAVGRYTTTDTCPAVPYEFFSKTMPFMYLRPFSDLPKEIAEGKDLILRIGGGFATTLEIVLFTRRSFSIAADCKVTRDF